MSSFQVEQIDHVELFVPDRYTAARWYEQALGLRILKEHEHWAGPGGPLMISSNGGGTMLALFEGQPRGSWPTAGHHRVAFRVSGAGFLQFLEHVREIPVHSESGEPVSHLPPVDHGKAFSVYFCDPYGNRFEVTSYEYQHIKSGLSSMESL
jgi:catechol 2,3-dioxygenase-like lactoylglutathione lyase family enzyme